MRAVCVTCVPCVQSCVPYVSCVCTLCVSCVPVRVSESFVTSGVSCVTVLVIGDALIDASESLRMALLQRDKAYPK